MIFLVWAISVPSDDVKLISLLMKKRISRTELFPQVFRQTIHRS